ncbi:DnaJ domain-containing protein [Desulfobacterales bacterium HSG17]|nr:DnaJ domain-containing protein [Desulfobacterales bacterium HSG17]
MENFYYILNIKETAKNEEIKTAFRKLARQYHPDTSEGDSEKFRQVHQAYKVLSDPESRKDYDRTLKNFQAKTGNFKDYSGDIYSVQGKHLKKILKEIITHGDFTDIKIRYKGTTLFDISFPMAAAISFIGLLKAPIIFLLFQLGVTAVFEIEISNHIVDMYNKAMEYHNKGKIIEAEHFYKKILKKSEYFMPAHINLGMLYRQRGENSKAVQCFKQVLETAPFGEIGEIAKKNLNELRGF